MSLERLRAALSDRYRLERELGAGGMATVYLAHDLKHDRDVAIKVLHADLGAALGPERFLSEIRTTAKLQHPHILPLLDSGDAAGLLYYVMPLVTGETLRSRLERERQLPIADAVRIAREVASALDYAHRQGVIHRDIKPENILLHDGQALVADFGIALAVQQASGARMTQTGLSLGTPQYMSPEQAMGEKQIDARSDVYALGAVTYEMLAGDAPFTGGSVQAIVAKIMTEKPTPLHTLRDTVPEHVEQAVLVALAKLPADRFATAAELGAALANPNYATTASHSQATSSRDGRRWQWVAAGLAVALVVVATAAALGLLRRDQPGVVRRFYITMSRFAADYGNAVISPNGEWIVYANTEGSLMIRRGSELEAKLIPSSEAAWAPVFSPDSRSIAINNGFPGALRILPIDGGPVRTLVAGATYGNGIAWSEDDWIYYLHGEDYGRDLMRIRASGGEAEFIARPDSSANALFFYWPQVLPGEKKLLLTVFPVRGEPGIGVLDIASGEVNLIATGIKGHYTQTGHILVVSNNRLLQAARFDPKRGELLGSLTTMAENLFVFSAASAAIAVSDEGTLLYQPEPLAGEVVRVFRDDGREELVDPDWRDEFSSLALSPDGTKIAIGVVRGGRTELWVKALGPGTFTRLSAGGTQNYRPSWSPDGRHVVFTSDQGGKITTYQVPSDGSAPPRRLLPMVTQTVDEAGYSADGEWVVFRGGSGGGRDIFAIQLGVDTLPRAMATGPAEEFSPALSPDGRWLAYASEETGRTEVYVRPFPDASSAKYPVSRNGGAEPLWSHSGRELFYRDGAENLVAVTIAPEGPFHVQTERVLFSTRGYALDNRHHHYTVAPDDRSFIFAKARVVTGSPNQLIITLNWFEELKRLVP